MNFYNINMESKLNNDNNNNLIYKKYLYMNLKKSICFLILNKKVYKL